MRVMSYNVHGGIGMDGLYDLERIVRTIAQADADIVGLQEVDVHFGQRSRFEHMADRLADRLGMSVYFAPIYVLPPSEGRKEERQFGVALLSRLPIRKTANHQLTRLSTQEVTALPEPKPGLLEAVLGAAERQLRVYVTHLDYRTDPAIRWMQIREMLQLAGVHTDPVLVLGDFNARPDAPELAPLFSAFPDSWTAVRADAGHTFPADQPDRKIDYILASGHMRTIRTYTIPGTASDHLPIVADLEFADRADEESEETEEVKGR
ncbi:MAG: hypothetical protein K0Q94_1804 [Paenibacillus sp.]|nr:hypothetical protein [Paenibacillus sp.]